MSPPEGGCLADRAAPGRLPDRFPLVHAFHVEQPALLVAKVRQGGFCQGIERPLASLTPITSQPMDISPGPNPAMASMGTGGRSSGQTSTSSAKVHRSA
jgi:hypothetical protein